jgi:hypothetical protein
MARRIIVIVLIVFCSQKVFAQQSSEAYGQTIYELIVSDNPILINEFVELAEYTAYIDRLAKLPEEQREAIKFDATRSYNDVQKDFQRECQRMLKLYRKAQASGIDFTYQLSFFEPSKNFPEIGFITCVYTTELPEDEEPLVEEDNQDAFKFEAIQTANGWRILDGFFTATLEP